MCYHKDMKENIVYMLICSNQHYYTGWTNDFMKRMKAHRQGKASHYTHAFAPKEIVYAQRFETKSDAMRKEAQIKRLSRLQKEELILQHAEQTRLFLQQHPFNFKGE